jgi:oligoribonuclease NrnB/cAMP/cGMP phosphodiesterase (DHH superfamily)
LELADEDAFKDGSWRYEEDNIFICLENYECGASMTWAHFFPDEPDPELIRYVRDRDLWQKTLYKTEEINAYLQLQNKTIACWDRLHLDMQTTEGRQAIINVGTYLLQQRNQMIAKIVEDGTVPITICGIEGLACNAPYQFASDIGHILATKSGTFGCVWSQQADKDDPSVVQINFSLRSNGLDVSAIAKELGGGGHNNAAGFILKQPLIDGHINVWNNAEKDPKGYVRSISNG